MHPALAEVVSHSFYDNELKTHDEAAARISGTPAPVSSSDTKRLPNAPLIFVDMPWIQVTIGMKGGDAERRLRWHNPRSRRGPRNSLLLLKVRPDLGEAGDFGRSLSIQRAGPPAESGVIDDRRDNFTVLSALAPAVAADQYCGTVDSFKETKQTS